MDERLILHITCRCKGLTRRRVEARRDGDEWVAECRVCGYEYRDDGQLDRIIASVRRG